MPYCPGGHMRTDVLGVGFDNITMDEAVSRALDIIENGESGYVVTPNPEIVMACRRDEQALRAVNGAELVIPDGIGIIYGARILAKPMKERIPGIEFAGRLMDKMQERGYKLFLFGAKPGVAEKAAERLREQYPNLTICGCENGYFTDSRPIIQEIRNSGADVVFVCLGAPKQEKWMAEHQAETGAKLMVGLGGSLDVFSGTVKRAPEFWQKTKLEWLYRALTDPKRFKRTLKLPAFMFAVTGQRLRGGKKNAG